MIDVFDWDTGLDSSVREILESNAFNWNESFKQLNPLKRYIQCITLILNIAHQEGFFYLVQIWNHNTGVSGLYDLNSYGEDKHKSKIDNLWIYKIVELLGWLFWGQPKQT